MAVYTCVEMVADCLAGRDAGWRHFITEYLSFAAAVLDRHYPQLGQTLVSDVLVRCRDEDARFFREYEGHSEREFLLHLRELVLETAGRREPAGADPEIPLDWETFTKAFAELTALERQLVWMFVLAPKTDDTALLLRMDDNTVRASMSKAQELLRAACDRWNPEMLTQNRRPLAQAARALPVQDCTDPKLFLRLLDGQITWRDRADLERHLTRCWRCVDLLCRFREVFYLSRRVRPLADEEAEPYFKVLGLTAPRRPLWKRVLGAG